MANFDNGVDAVARDDREDGLDLVAVLAPAARRWKLLMLAAIVGAAIGVGASFLVRPKFTAINVFLPPQQQGNGAANALASLGALSGLAGNAGNTRNSPEQYIALMQSATIADRIIKKFDLAKLWETKFQVDARKRLAKQVNISAERKDGLLRVEFTDPVPARAAAIANQYVEELRTLTTTFAVSEAQQRRVFFETLLQQTRDKLAAAQTALEAGGYTAGALNSEPRNAAEGYARVQADLASAQVKLQVLRSSLADSAPEVRTQQETVNALASQLAKLESQDKAHSDKGDYVNRYREYKYQEMLFDLFGRQYENARVDESREGALIQVLDPATPPERKSAPGRLKYGALGAVLGLLIAAVLVLTRGRKDHGS
jgi:uncharacterized protein involved in exopolysaccharide biosynthesis